MNIVNGQKYIFNHVSGNSPRSGQVCTVIDYAELGFYRARFEDGVEGWVLDKELTQVPDVDYLEAADRAKLPKHLQDATILQKGVYFWTIEKDGNKYRAEFDDDGSVIVRPLYNEDKSEPVEEEPLTLEDIKVDGAYFFKNSSPLSNGDRHFDGQVCVVRAILSNKPHYTHQIDVVFADGETLPAMPEELTPFA